MKQKIVVVVGSTAVGKSALAVRLARTFNGEIISADSRQVYRGLNIGTGKITHHEMQGVSHHLLDVTNPKKQFSVVRYIVPAEKTIADISSRGKIPIICGGTGFYISALVDGIVLPDVPANPDLRTRLKKKTPSELFQILQKLDPRRAKEIDKYNARRIIRAIEIAEALGNVPKLSALRRYNPLFIGITLAPQELQKRIRVRLFKRMQQDMVAEAKRLHIGGLSWKRMDELGLEYRYLALHLQGKLTRAEMLKKLNTEIWHYAKRQMTWFKRDKRIKWFTDPFSKPTNERIKNIILKFLRI
ncbi:MAG: tRNA (adenosine(37)-N6)-dimethylallyltransferase MiaA [Candidatus Taylorbacteria bacterium RIFCSPHIGHO2_02_FULL_46_13]|uniref:tRNA dimethylallyltransferase n=1 Tax=Candidatus Taylorbacteria bacterium RIFCSPHIGHO2_02_FULL_46_13 TaxID=1802312 RepID=A0A1G2MQD7_9BACT|nr:MAG: tRNA (adenosine(37)-N6)-dimethylallyltransferase MiaA [Candidatus Taylorbacteria bacterium RIFCSPHIGHO2_02_FULL_46_13]